MLLVYVTLLLLVSEGFTSRQVYKYQSHPNIYIHLSNCPLPTLLTHVPNSYLQTLSSSAHLLNLASYLVILQPSF